MRRLTCLTDRAAGWVARPYALGLAGWRNAKSIGRIGRASVAFGRAAARWFDVRLYEAFAVKVVLIRIA